MLVFILSIPFWLAGIFIERFLPKGIAVNLPFSALTFLSMLGAAAILTFRENGWNSVGQLLKRPFDFSRVGKKAWYFPVFFLMPVLFVLEYGVMKLMGASFPDLQIPILMAPIFFVAFFIANACEEIGWMGYAIEPLQGRWGALGAGLIMGSVWAIWHIIPYIQAHNPLMWIIWQCAFTIANRILIVWLYNNTGKSVFVATLFHAMYDLCWSLYPNYGSHYDPFITFALTAVAAVIVVFLWRPKTLAQYRYV